MPAAEAQFYVRAAILAGIRDVKLTGGEPLIYRHESRDITSLTEAVCEEASGRATLSITTNGQLLERHAERLAKTAISHVTVSVHTLQRDLFRREISDSGSPVQQLEGIRAAKKAGVHVKANVVVLPSSIDGVLDLCQALFRAGVAQIRLYRALWSPLDAAQPGTRRVSDGRLVALATEASGLIPRSEVLDYSTSFLQSATTGLPRTLSFDGPMGAVEVDRMPIGTPTSGPEDEGDYAIRISAVGGLHARIFSETKSLATFAAESNLDEAVRQISKARRELNALD